MKAHINPTPVVSILEHYCQVTSGRETARLTFDTLPDSAFIRQAQLIPHIVPFSSATLWRKCKTGDFPRPVKLSERVSAWQLGEVRAWLKEQVMRAPK